MAVQSFFPVMPSGSNVTPCGTRVAVTGTSSTITLGRNLIVRIVADAAVNIRFGDSTITTATANDVYFPANMPEVVDMGANNTSFKIFTATTANVYYTIISRS